LRREDFRVFDDGRLVPIVAFGKVRQPIHVILLLDTSRSMAESLSVVRSAAEAVIAQLAPDDSIRVGTFSSILRLSPPFSFVDRHLAARVPLVRAANMTALYDAIAEACDVFTTDMDRRTIFVVSDGTDTASAASARTVMQRAANANVAVYAVGVSSRNTERGKTTVRAPDSTLRDIAEDTGGRYVYAGGAQDFSSLFASMVDELHHQYILGFTPAHADGRLHSLVVTVRRPNTTVRARKHYVAPAR
jgi:Ca-activated chloride channel family protein